MSGTDVGYDGVCFYTLATKCAVLRSGNGGTRPTRGSKAAPGRSRGSGHVPSVCVSLSVCLSLRVSVCLSVCLSV
eukprot:3195103-Rhodomonas_salina.1